MYLGSVTFVGTVADSTSTSYSNGWYSYTTYRDPRPECHTKEEQIPAQNPLEFFGFDENKQGK